MLKAEGSKLEADELLNGWIVELWKLKDKVKGKGRMERIPITKEGLERLKEESYFFKMGKYQKQLLEFYDLAQT